MKTLLQSLDEERHKATLEICAEFMTAVKEQDKEDPKVFSIPIDVLIKFIQSLQSQGFPQDFANLVGIQFDDLVDIHLRDSRLPRQTALLRLFDQPLTVRGISDQAVNDIGLLVEDALRKHPVGDLHRNVYAVLAWIVLSNYTGILLID